jgi:hypothetical protein
MEVFIKPLPGNGRGMHMLTYRRQDDDVINLLLFFSKKK